MVLLELHVNDALFNQNGMRLWRIVSPNDVGFIMRQLRSEDITSLHPVLDLRDAIGKRK